MKYRFLLCGILLCLLGADKPTISPIEKEALEVEQMIKELPVKEAAIRDKEYAGTIDAVLSERIADVNDVLVYAKTMTEKAKAVCEKLDLDVSKKDYVKVLIDRHAKIEEKEKQKQNNEFMKSVVGVIDEVSAAVPVDDPNYVATLDLMREFLVACVEICSPK